MRGLHPGRATLTLAALLALTACTPAACDPSRADFFAGVGCSVSGNYDTREQVLRNNVAAAQANELQRQAEATRASADEANAAQDLDRRRRQLALLDGRLNEMQRELAAARGRKGVDQAALRRAQNELTSLRTQRAHVTPHSDDAQLHALEAPTRQLGDELSREGL